MQDQQSSRVAQKCGKRNARDGTRESTRSQSASHIDCKALQDDVQGIAFENILLAHIDVLRLNAGLIA
jgi:hypothetical protein